MQFSYLFAGIALSSATPASASVFGDDFARCLVTKTTADDKAVLVQWIYTIMAAHPAVASMSNITDVQRASFNRRAGALMDRLVTKDCRAEGIAAIKYDGVGALQASFEVLGKVAMQDFVGNDRVTAQVEQLQEAVNLEAWSALMREAGVSVPAGSPKTK